MKNNPPTAEEFIKEGVEGCPLRDIINNLNDEEIIEIMIDFAKLHVKLALEAAANNADLYPNSNCYGEGGYCTNTRVDKDSILNAYPLENIK